MTLSDPRFFAFKVIDEIMAEGLKKHQAERWRHASHEMHIIKASRHISTYLLMKDGHVPQDGENHLKNALTRLSFALVQLLDGDIE